MNARCDVEMGERAYAYEVAASYFLGCLSRSVR